MTRLFKTVIASGNKAKAVCFLNTFSKYAETENF